MMRMSNLRFIYIPNQLEGGNALPIPWSDYHAHPSDFHSNVDVEHILRSCKGRN